jgi:hypothetical protein
MTMILDGTSGGATTAKQLRQNTQKDKLCQVPIQQT